ncbi:MAG: 2-amino-4-hydroxy-6-hydroxymethyldihydropteridine diphosphokinase [Clostridia bacterium]|nr:2-amino-4-hydroxy-6-hydroxymethyldihydropteridine diphosphokinase [Clostridia bacterium]
MGAIDIKGLEVTACHGVLPQEKTNPQPFVFDISIDCDTLSAAKSDDVNDTVNYAEVCETVTAFCKQNSFNLIERLAYGAAFTIVEKYAKIKAAEVTVHKPQAPVGLPFSDISVTARVERNKVVLSLGSSEGDRKATLDGAVKEISALRGVKLLKTSDYIKTEPYGGAAQNEFLNCAVLTECLISPRDLLNAVHAIEAKFGRKREVRWGDRTLDIDIIFFGNKVIAEEGLSIPHPDYKSRDFVLTPLKQIAPDFVCPVTGKRVSDM